MHFSSTSLIVLLMVVSAAQADSGPPQVRQDSDVHWDWREGTWPNAGQALMIRRAAEAGDAQAQFKLALMFDAGKGAQQDFAEAAKWLHRAARQGLVAAQYNLGAMYDAGRGVAQDHAEAGKWYRAAAEQGYVSAQKNLAVKYGLGQGVPQSHIEAYIWSALAAQSGDEGAVSNRDLAASRLSVTELEAAQRWAAKRYQAIQQRHSVEGRQRQAPG